MEMRLQTDRQLVFFVILISFMMIHPVDAKDGLQLIRNESEIKLVVEQLRNCSLLLYFTQNNDDIPCKTCTSLEGIILSGLKKFLKDFPETCLRGYKLQYEALSPFFEKYGIHYVPSVAFVSRRHRLKSRVDLLFDNDELADYEYVMIRRLAEIMELKITTGAASIIEKLPLILNLGLLGLVVFMILYSKDIREIYLAKSFLKQAFAVFSGFMLSGGFKTLVQDFPYVFLGDSTTNEWKRCTANCLFSVSLFLLSTFSAYCLQIINDISIDDSMCLHIGMLCGAQWMTLRMVLNVFPDYPFKFA